MFLVDTNIWLEVLLNQERQNEARDFIQGVKARDLAITRFALYSAAIHLTRRGKYQAYAEFLSNVIEKTAIQVIQLTLDEMRVALDTAQKFTLDFDDAYQYVAAEKHGLTIVSFDAHFDRTERGRKTPGQALEVYVQKEENGESSA